VLQTLPGASVGALLKALMAKKPNIHVMPTRMRIPNALLILSSPSEPRSGSAAFGGRVASLYMINENVTVLMRITSKTGAMNAAKNAMSPRRQLKKMIPKFVNSRYS